MSKFHFINLHSIIRPGRSAAAVSDRPPAGRAGAGAWVLEPMLEPATKLGIRMVPQHSAVRITFATTSVRPSTCSVGIVARRFNSNAQQQVCWALVHC
eukprot:SAG31_NODE_4366_length_3307_cov_2.745636_1_plen_98_part_00